MFNVLLVGVCIAALIGLYYLRQSVDDSLYAALIALTSGAAFFFSQMALTARSEDTLQRLAGVPRIEELVSEAQRKSTQVEQLRHELDKLEEIVEISARQRYLQRQLATLQNDIRERLTLMSSVEKEMTVLEIPETSSLTREEIKRVERVLRLRERGFVFLKVGKYRIPLNPGAVGPFSMDLSPLIAVIRRLLDRRKRKRV